MVVVVVLGVMAVVAGAVHILKEPVRQPNQGNLNQLDQTEVILITEILAFLVAVQVVLVFLAELRAVI
jgi:hypothetical protein